MNEAINALTQALSTLGKGSPWSSEIKVTDDFLEPLFKKYFDSLKLPLLLRKTDYHQLARLIAPDRIDPEVIQKLDAILTVANSAKPRRN